MLVQLCCKSVFSHRFELAFTSEPACPTSCTVLHGDPAVAELRNRPGDREIHVHATQFCSLDVALVFLCRFLCRFF